MTEPIKILLLAANPKDTQPLRLGEEVREIETALRQANYRDRFKPISKFAVRVSDLRDEMLHVSPQIVHFSGHGVGEAGLVLEDDMGKQSLVGTEALTRWFKLFADTVECVVLNACYSEFQAEAINQYIRYVIGMNQAIGDRAAIEFAKGFYTALGAGRSIESAFEIGCASLDLRSIPESFKPQLKIKPGSDAEWVSRKLTVEPEPNSKFELSATPNPQTPPAQPKPQLTNSDRPTVTNPPIINAQNSQGFINHASAPVTQHFGNQTTIDTGGGDYAGRDLYKNDRSTDPDTVSLQTIAHRIEQLAEQAENRGDDDLADDLRSIGLTLGAAIKAEQEGKRERREAKLGEVRRSIEGMVKEYPALQGVLSLLKQV